jgi:hypothetical protein
MARRRAVANAERRSCRPPRDDRAPACKRAGLVVRIRGQLLRLRRTWDDRCSGLSQPLHRSLLVIELKTELVDVQGLLGSVDRYRRLAPGLARQRGWDSAATSVWVVLRETDVNRRRVAAHAAVLRAALPADGWGMRRWLREPRGVIAGLSFLSDARVRSVSGAIGGIRRVRRRERA